MTLSLIAPALLALCAQDARPASATTEAEAPSVTRVYDFSAFGGRRAMWTGTGLMVPALHAVEIGFDFPARGNEYETSDPQDVMHLVYEHLHEELEYEGRGTWMLPDGRKYAVRAPEDVHARFLATMDFLTELEAAGAALSVDVVHTRDASGPVGLVSRAEADRWLAGRASDEIRGHYRLEVGGADVAGFEDTSIVHSVVDWDAEIAQGAVIHDPITAGYEIGRRLSVAGAPTSGGLLLALTLHQTDVPGPPVARTNRYRMLLGSEGGGYELIDGPEETEYSTAWNRALSLNTAIGDDQALVLRFDLAAGHELEAFHEAIVIRREGASIPLMRELTGVGADWVAVNAGALMPPVASAAHEDRMKHNERFLSVWADLRALGVRGQEGVPGTLIRLGNPEEALFAIESARYMDEYATFGGWTMIRPRPEDADEPVPSIGEVVRAAMPRVETANVTLELRRGGADGALLRRVGVALRAGEESAVAVGVERSYLRDYDVEVAQYAAIADQYTAIAFEGILCGLQLDGLPNGGLRLVLDGSAGALQGPPRRIEHGSQFASGITSYDIRMLDLDRTLRVGADERDARFVLGNQVDGGDGLTLVVHVAR